MIRVYVLMHKVLFMMHVLYRIYKRIGIMIMILINFYLRYIISSLDEGI